LRGLGAEATIVAAPAGMSAIQVGASGGGALEVSLSGLRVRGDGAEGTAAVLVQGAQTTLTVRDAAVEGAVDGLRVEQGSLCGQGLTVLGARHVGIVLSDGSAAALSGVLVRDGAGVGVLVRASVIALRSGLVAHNARDGVALLGGRSGEGVCDPSAG